MTTTQAIQTAIENAYTQITLPGGLGAPSAASEQSVANPASLPFVEVYRGVATEINYDYSATGYTVTRDFIARLYVEKLSNDNARPDVREAPMNLAADCIDAVHDYFASNRHAINHASILAQTMTQDTGDTELSTLNNDSYAGVAFRHAITYYRKRG